MSGDGPRVGVVLSGCGVYDGAEIHEAVLTMLALDERDARIVCMAPSGPQMHVINHVTGDVSGETRDVLVESARIARGDITDLAEVQADDLDALVFPGGFGAAKNLCDFATRGPECEVHPEVARLVRAMHAAGKPLGFACIAPAMAAKIFQQAGVSTQMTVGSDDDEAAGALRDMGAVHVGCPVTEARVDDAQRITTTPAYMLGQRISDVRAGIDRMVEGVLGMLDG